MIRPVAICARYPSYMHNARICGDQLQEARASTRRGGFVHDDLPMLVVSIDAGVPCRLAWG